jgi:acetyl-CoA C-acetyltransferase
MAGVKPEDIDVAEVHDCFTIAEIIAYEDLGFCKPGEGGKLAENGETKLGGRIPSKHKRRIKGKRASGGRHRNSPSLRDLFAVDWAS